MFYYLLNNSNSRVNVNNRAHSEKTINFHKTVRYYCSLPDFFFDQDPNIAEIIFIIVRDFSYFFVNDILFFVLQ